MQRYKNLSGKSGVTHYKIGRDFIEIKFVRETRIYIYNYKLNGKRHIETMKQLAQGGKGLATYISQHPEVKNNYTTQ